MSGVAQGALRANKVWVTEHTAFGSLRKDVGFLLFFFFDLFSFEGSHMPYKEKVKQQQEKKNNNTHTNNKKRYEREACHTTKLKRKEKMGILSAFLQFEHGAGGHNSYSSFFFKPVSSPFFFSPFKTTQKTNVVIIKTV